jgi:hypothetical protein
MALVKISLVSGNIQVVPKWLISKDIVKECYTCLWLQIILLYALLQLIKLFDSGRSSIIMGIKSFKNAVVYSRQSLVVLDE